ncbi:copper chaperone SCO1/SenC [Chloropicon primus]|uniref:Copper chaperone SCO1/SenC n=2 Tax=Chloropicon primus TaxID=1764295 RepID=A0A5B8MIQ8_9CHLO|nr:copper chaperone SCO1/SenC [Chloropicon primus]UPQ99175.1 copper chaperone SCO1/SenC [Chloropicon primus]|eukprot:QDZ19964.1 copper chaperone SCO1/SenC [Chloropicon primus]
MFGRWSRLGEVGRVCVRALVTRTGWQHQQQESQRVVARSLGWYRGGACRLGSPKLGSGHHGARAARYLSSKPSSDESGAASSSSFRIPPQAVSYGSLAVLVATAGGIVTYYKYLREEQVKGVKNLPSSGKAAVGGPWTLMGPDGKAFESRSLEGEFSLLYFGFTFCPDICPDELEKIAESVDLLEKITKRKIRPVFITIDPERDDTEIVNEYVKEFHPRLLGLTGTKEQIKKITRLFRVYFSKTSESDEDYLIDHSIISYLVDPEGNFVKFFGKNSTANDMAMEMKRFVDNWKNTHKNY